MKRLLHVTGFSFAMLTACNGGLAEGTPDASRADADVGDGARDGGAVCASGSITFVFQAEDAAQFSIGAAASCANVWLTILAADGNERVVDRPCLPDCSDCEPYGCPASCAAPQHMTSSGVSRTWDGAYYASGTCGGGASCVERQCVGPGRYTARMCAYRDLGTNGPNGLCAPASTPTCTDVPFDWPPAATVNGTLGAAGCCPASWSMYGCTYPDGGTGLACHNPALGCPSSTTCSEGCDGVVRGRCDGG